MEERAHAIALLEQLASLEKSGKPLPIQFHQRELLKALAEIAPFSAWMGCSITVGAMGSSVGYMGPEHAAEALSTGRSPIEIIDGFARLARSNVAEFLSVYAVRGVRASHPVPIGDHLTLLPVAMAPPGNYTKEIFEEGMPRRASNTISGRIGGHGVPGFAFTADNGLAVSALVFTHQLSPVAAATSADLNSHKKFAEEQAAVQDFRRAAIISCTHNVALPVSYSVCTDPDYPSKMQSMQTHLPDGFVPPTQSAPLDEVAKCFEQMSQLPQKDLASLRVAIDRLANAREPRSFVDLALDFGIAMEVLLMHGAKEEGKELNHKIGLRAGWMLGTTVAERLAYRKLAAELYAKRSNAAHTGRLDGEFDPVKYDAFVVALVRAILDRSGFPDWQTLTFGG